jgi:hypothetical protein
MPIRAVGIRPSKAVYIGVEILLVSVTIAALVERLSGADWGLGWGVFFLGFVASAWGAASYPVCASCGKWDHHDG